MNNGKFVDNNYPIIHIWISTLSMILGLNPKQIILMTAPVYCTFFAIYMFLLSRSLKLRKGETFLVFALSMIPIFAAESIYTVPSAEAFFLIPLVLFLYIKSRTVKSNAFLYSILLIIMLLIFPFFHPETSFLLVIILLLIYLIINLYTRFNLSINLNNKIESKISNSNYLIKRNTIIPALFLFIGFFWWFTSSLLFGSTIETLYKSIFLDLTVSAADIVQKSSLKGVLLYYNIMKIYGVDIFYIFIATLTSLGIIKTIIKKKINIVHLIFLVVFIAMILLNFVSYFKGAMIGLRTVKYLLLISIFLCSIILYKILKNYSKSNYSKIKMYVFSIGLICIIGLSIFNTYPSPIIRTYSYHVTEDSHNGMDFLINYGSNTPILSTLYSPQRFVDSIRGIPTIKNYNYAVKREPIDHFGYEKNLNDTKNNYGSTNIQNITDIDPLVGNLGNFYNNLNYLIIFSATTKFGDKYNTQDYQKLNNDVTLDKLYENGGFELYLVNGRYKTKN
ncbi:MAG: hypothetical protein ACOX08_12070 [Methanobacterium sp.]